MPLLTVRCSADIDVLVSNVAVSPHFGPFFETTEDAWVGRQSVHVKLKGELVPLFAVSCGLTSLQPPLPQPSM